MVGIYCIENLKNGRRYIVQSINIIRRLNNHKSSLNRTYHSNVYLQRAWNKYGENNFSFTVLIECHPIDLDELESYFISHYKTMENKYGYNLEGGGNRNKVMSKETRQKISKSKRGKNFMSSEYLEKLSERMKGNKYALGHRQSDATKKKKSESAKRFWQNVSKEVKEKMLSNLRSRRTKSVED